MGGGKGGKCKCVSSKKEWMLKNLDQALEKEIKELKGAGEGHAEELSRASSVAETSKEELSVSFFLSFFLSSRCSYFGISTKLMDRLFVSPTNNLQPPMPALSPLLPVTRKTLRTSSDN